MRIRLLLRAFFTFTTLAVVWFVTSPALASSTPPALSSVLADGEHADDSVPTSSRAPLCDPRGATMFAPPPQMQDVELTIDTGLTLDDCMARKPSSPTHASRGRTPLPIDATASGDWATDRIVMLAAAGRELLGSADRAASTSCPCSGVRSTVDRPPRA